MSNLLIGSLRVKGPASVIDDPNVSYDWFKLGPVVLFLNIQGVKVGPNNMIGVQCWDQI